MRQSHDTIVAHAAVNYRKRFERHHYESSAKVIELWDYIGDGGEPKNVDITPYEPVPPENHWMRHAGNNLGVKYSQATDFVHAFSGAYFDAPTIIDIGEMPAPVDKRGEPIGDPCIDMSGMFAHSGLQMLPRGGSRGLIAKTDAMFADCKLLRSWTPHELVAAGLAMVADPTANRRLRSSGLDEPAFLMGIAPLSMRHMFLGCTSYNGHAIGAIGFHRVNHPDGMSDFAKGCTFAPHNLAGIVESMWWNRFRRKRFTIPQLNNVHLGSGRLTGEAAKHCQELRESGIEIVGPELG